MTGRSAADDPSVPWRDRAECLSSGEDPELWFSDAPADLRAARAICGVCPVRRPCLRDAMAAEGAVLTGHWGVVGGLTRHQRQRFHERQRRQQAAS